MPSIDPIIDALIALLLLPLNAVMYPIDLLLAQVPGLDAIPAALRAILSFVGTLPQTLVALSGVSPVLWNIQFSLLVLWMFGAPAINIIKKLWGWIRP